MALGLYIHVPFCRGKCMYCDFPGGFIYTPEAGKLYTAALKLEAALYLKEYPHLPEIETLYFGGGTPSLLETSDISDLIHFLSQNFKTSLKETTLEANPEDVTIEKAREWKQMGIDRISMGFQSMEAEILKSLGRKNTPETNRQSFQNARDAGFKNITADLICSVRGENIKKSLSEMIELQPEHISIYALSVEEKTMLYQKVKKGEYEPLSDEEYAETDAAVSKKLVEAGFERYEISNFAKKPEFQSLHNMNYWNYGEYIGLGTGASGYLKQNEKGFRWTNITNLKEYESKVKESQFPRIFTEEIDFQTAVREYLMLGLRKKEGIRLRDFQNEFGKPFYSVLNKGKISALESFLIRNESFLALRPEAISVSNAVVRSIWEAVEAE